VRNVTSLDVEVEVGVTVRPQAARRAATTIAAARIRRRRGDPPTGAALLAQLHPLVAGALQELLVLLLPHLLAALLDQ
jgi:hypothetical protein